MACQESVFEGVARLCRTAQLRGDADRRAVAQHFRNPLHDLSRVVADRDQRIRAERQCMVHRARVGVGARSLT